MVFIFTVHHPSEAFLIIPVGASHETIQRAWAPDYMESSMNMNVSWDDSSQDMEKKRLKTLQVGWYFVFPKLGWVDVPKHPTGFHSSTSTFLVAQGHVFALYGGHRLRARLEGFSALGPQTIDLGAETAIHPAKYGEKPIKHQGF